jgi:hypothetical protein
VEAGGERGPASRQLCGSDRDGRRSGGVQHHAGAGERAAHVGRPGKKRAGPGLREQCRPAFKTNFQTEHDLIQSKNGFIVTKNFQIKYGREGIKIRSNFIHRNFSRIEMDFKLKF